jgi:uncharacterized membrane protein
MIDQNTPIPEVATALPKERIKALDLARGVAMVFVVVIHVLEQLSSQTVKDSLFGGILNIGTALCAATMFMFLMGAGFSLSRKTSLRAGVMRGIALFGLAYVLNVLRGTLPTYVGLWTHQFTLEELKPYSPLYVTIEIDILQFAGLALIILSLLRRFVNHWAAWLLVGCGILALCPVVFGHKTGSPVLDYFINFLWRTEEYGHFPIFPWLAFPLFGMAFGQLLKNAKNADLFFAKNCFIGILICICGAYLTYSFSDFSMGSWMSGEYNEGANHPCIVMSETGFLLAALSVYHFLAAKIPWNRAFEWLSFWSKEVTLMYCLQWIVIGWIVVFIPSYAGFAGTIGYMLLVFAATHLSGIAWIKSTRTRRKK